MPLVLPWRWINSGTGIAVLTWPSSISSSGRKHVNDGATVGLPQKKGSSMKARTSTLSLLALIGILAFTPSLVQAQAPAPTGQRLRNLAGSFPIGFAAESDFWNLPDAAQYQQTAASEFSMLTPGNQLKWDTTEPQQNVFNF